MSREIIDNTKEHPIIFSTPMVQAILEGKKTQTRRIIKPRTPEDFALMVNMNAGIDVNEQIEELIMVSSSPYGKVGDVLWVREAWNRFHEYYYRASDSQYCEKWKPSIYMPKDACRIRLKITDIRVERVQDISDTDAFAEGINDEGEEYITAEHYQLGGSPIEYGSSAIFAFKALWGKINGEESWNANPWVWVIEFERLIP